MSSIDLCQWRNNIFDMVIEGSNKTAHAAKHFCNTFMMLANKSTCFAKDTLGLNNENVHKLLREIYISGSNLNALFPSNANLYFMIRVIESALKDINPITPGKQHKRLLILDAVNVVKPMWIKHASEDPLSRDLVYIVLWYTLKKKVNIKNFPSEEDKKIKSWNTRVDELQLIQKLGSPKNWEIHSENKITEAENNSEDTFENRDADGSMGDADMSNNGLTDDDLVESDDMKNNKTGGFIHMSEPTKKYNLLRPISKFFKIGKHQKCKETPVAGKYKNNSSVQQVKNSLHNKKTSNLEEKSSPGEKWLNTPNSVNTSMKTAGDIDHVKHVKHVIEHHDVEPESLTIQIPSNINRIVLIKNGRKIAVEL